MGVTGGGANAYAQEHEFTAGNSGTTPAVPGPPVAGYHAWWDASQITGAADGTTLASWADLSGNGNTLTQTTAADRPTYYSTTAGKTVNGKAAVWFNGTSDFFNSSFSPAQPYTICLVAAPTTTNVSLILWSDPSAHTFFEFNTNATVKVSGFVATGTYGTAPAWYITVLNGASSVIQFAPGSTTGTDNGSLTNFVLGSYQGTGGFYWNGPVCEVIVYPSALSSADRTSVAAYLKSKWGTA